MSTTPADVTDTADMSMSTTVADVADAAGMSVSTVDIDSALVAAYALSPPDRHAPYLSGDDIPHAARLRAAFRRRGRIHRHRGSAEPGYHSR